MSPFKSLFKSSVGLDPPCSPSISGHSSHRLLSVLGFFPRLIARNIWIMCHVKNRSDNRDTATQAAHTSSRPLAPTSLPACLCVCVLRAYLPRICASDGAHVFMHSGRTGAACNSSPACRSKEHSRCSDVSARENKQNRGHFIQDRGTVKIRSGPSPPPPPKQGLRCAGHSSTPPEGGEARGSLFCRMFVQPAFQTHKSFTRDFMYVCSRGPSPSPSPSVIVWEPI